MSPQIEGDEGDAPKKRKAEVEDGAKKGKKKKVTVSLKKKKKGKSGLSQKRLSPGTAMIGAVSAVYPHHLMISLPNQLTGVARRNDIIEVRVSACL